jgi:hypothetical protein
MALTKKKRIALAIAVSTADALLSQFRLSEILEATKEFAFSTILGQLARDSTQVPLQSPESTKDIK